ncbi:MAG: methyltransferase type 11 [Candidatus Puniceispirillum sp.]|nr:methyltransferase type 11 [Candidatus Puniceispirillum sp.]
MTLPLSLQEKMEALMVGHKAAHLRQAREDLTQAYHGEATPHMEGLEARLSYLATRMPATFAVARSVLTQVPNLGEKVATLLDLGAGPGTVLWALESLISFESATLVEQDTGLMRLCEALREGEATPHTVLCQDVLQDLPWQDADLVTISYLWGELEGQGRLDFLEKAFAHARHALVLIEPGTPRHTAGLLEARDYLIGMGAHIAAPCPHALACPVKAPDWCHFSAFVPRSALHRQVKNVSQSYELEKYSYLIVMREALDAQKDARLVRAPLKRSGHVVCDVCTNAGTLARWTYTKKDKEAYHAARKKEWGETITPPSS